MPTYNIGNKIFTSIKKCTDYVRTELEQHGVGNALPDDPAFKFMMDLLQNHHNVEAKIGCGIKYLTIGKSVIGKGLTTSITRTDDSHEYFSWIHCCSLKVKTTEQRRIACMRDAIHFDIGNFRDSNPKICCLCSSISAEEYHVDHHSPSFEQLSKAFQKQASSPLPETFDKCKSSGLMTFKKEDDLFKEKWVKYHLTNCSLQILCSTCNLKKQKK